MTLRLLTFETFHARRIMSRDDDIRPGRGGGGSGGGEVVRPKIDSELLEFVKALARAEARKDHRRFTLHDEAAERGKAE